MQSDKILATLVAHPGVGAKELGRLSDVNPHTVTTVLQRFEHAISAAPAPPTGKKGRPEHLYTVKPDWVSVFAGDAEPPAASAGSAALDRIMITMEAAALAAADPQEDAAERSRMAEMVKLRVRSARRLLASAADEVRREVEPRILRAERLAQAPRDRIQSSEQEGLLRKLWGRWVGQVAALADQFGLEMIGAEPELNGVAMVLDLIPGSSDAVAKALVEMCKAHRKPALYVPLAKLAAAQRSRFIIDFSSLALDPISSYANLFISLNSAQPTSKTAWHQIVDVAKAEHLFQAAPSAYSALLETISSSPTVDPEAIAPVTAVYNDFFKQLKVQTAIHENLRSSQSGPQVFDVRMDQELQVEVEERRGHYYPKAASLDFSQVTVAPFELAAA